MVHGVCIVSIVLNTVTSLEKPLNGLDVHLRIVVAPERVNVYAMVVFVDTIMVLAIHVRKAGVFTKQVEQLITNIA